jgi:hypothetical protein
MFPLGAGIGTCWCRLPGGHQASSLTPLIMNILKANKKKFMTNFQKVKGFNNSPKMH